MATTTATAAASSLAIGSSPLIRPTSSRDEFSKSRSQIHLRGRGHARLSSLKTSNSFQSIASPSRFWWPRQVLNTGLRSRSEKTSNLRHQSCLFNKQRAECDVLQQFTRVSCFSRRRVSSYLGLGSRTAFPRVFRDKSSPCYPFAKSCHVTHATAGPDEPHAASTTWPDGILEKQDSDVLYPELGQAELDGFLTSGLPSHPKLHRGQLQNGLQYRILPNKIPANRFEAHMEIHAGSIDEEDDEQGIAHMIEHVAFLGSRKREKLLGTGARSNAYTDFHHTVFHIHSPTRTKDSDEDLLPSVLDALNEIAFQPKFLTSRVEKERRAILSELQMMNTIEYRVDCQLLQHLHSENKLSKRFPIGLEEQIKKWDADKIRKFHERWYFPANATLYIVGDIDNIPNVVSYIEAVFGRTGIENEAASPPPPSAFGAMANFLVPKLSGGLAGNISNERLSSSEDQHKITRKERHAVRPPVTHNWSLPGSGTVAKPPVIFQHELLQNFSINMFCKVPVNKVRTYGDLRNVLMKRIFLSALHFRINTRYNSSNPPFTSVELDHSDSGREGCTVTTLTVTAEPKNWHSAIKVAVQEARRLKEFGVTNGELTRYLDALIKDSEHLAAMIDNVSSVDNLDFIMESDALGHTVMDQRQGHESLLSIAGTVTLEEVNSVGAEVLEYISDFGKPTAPLPAAIVACVPKKIHVDGVGEMDFNLSPDEITAAIKAGLEEPIEAEPELEVPKELITSMQLQDLKLQCNPSFINLIPYKDIELYDKETGITQRRLSNGISVNYKISKNESQGGVMRLIVGGGRAEETPEARGSVVVGVRTLSEGGRVGNFSREQVELFCVNHLINCSLESTEEFICMEFRFTLRDNGMRAAFQLLHMVLEHSVWLDDAFDRARQLYLSFTEEQHWKLTPSVVTVIPLLHQTKRLQQSKDLCVMYSRSNSFSRNVNNGKESPTLTGRNIPVAGSLNHRRAQSLNGISSSNKSSSKCNSNGFDENSLDLFSLKNLRSSNAHNALPSSDDSSDASLKLGRLSLGSLKVSRNGLDDLLSTTDGGKHDYDWLLTPPETPLFPSSDGSERQPMSAAPRSASLARSTSTTKPSRLSVSQSENNHPSRPARSSSITRPSLSTSHYSTYSSSRSTSILNTSSASVSSYIRPSSPSSRSSSSARPSTPSARTSSRSSTPSRSRPSTATTSNEKPRSSSRPSTPSSRPHNPANLSSPAARSGSRPSTPTRRSSAPSLSMTLGSLTSNGRIPLNGRSSAPSSRASSPGPRPRTPQQPIIPPDFPLDTPPNLRTSLADRPLSAGRSRPGVSLTTKGNPEASGPASMPKRQSSPIVTRGRLTESPVRGRLNTNGHSLDKPESRRATNVSELAGRKPVKSSTPMSDSMGFGRSISKRSLDMAIRHMDIKNGTGGNRLLSGTTTLFPQSVRSASTKNHSPRGTSTSASNNTNGYQPAGRNQYTFDGNHINRAPENGYSPDNAHYSAKLSEVDIYESTRYDAMFLKEDLKNTSWLHSVDDKADQGPIFDNGFESLPEPFELL